MFLVDPVGWRQTNIFLSLVSAFFMEYLSITDSYDCFPAYHVALADGLPYQ